MEKFTPSVETPKREKKASDSRLRKIVELGIAPLISGVEIKGKEHLDELPPEKRVVVATTHISDIDIPIALKALGEDLDLVISDMSTNHLFKNIGIKAGLMAAGEHNFKPIDFVEQKEGFPIAKFNPDNFIEMTEKTDKDVIVAAHNPSRRGTLEDGGVGAVYLAQLADSVILPVAVNIPTTEQYQSTSNFLETAKNVVKTITERPKAEVSLGAPITFEKIEGIDDYKKILDKRKSGDKLSREEIDRFKEISAELRKQSESLMEVLSQMTPEEKRKPQENSPKT